jgi:hypothetical protein
VHEDLAWDTPVQQAMTVSQYLPPDCLLTAPVLAAIVAVMRTMADPGEPWFYPDDATRLDLREPGALMTTLTYSAWKVAVTLPERALEVFVQLVEDGTSVTMAGKCALALEAADTTHSA